MEKEYFIEELKFQKSYSFLWPLIGFKKLEKFKPENTYLYWTEADYSIDDYNLLTFFKTDYNKEFLDFEEKEITSKSNVVACFKVEGGILYVWDLVTHSNSVAEFVQGRYSKFTEADKKIILSYFGDSTNTLVIPGRPIYMGLYPDKFYKVVAEELNVDESYLKELINKYDLEEEICHLPIIEEHKCAPDKKTLYLGNGT